MELPAGVLDSPGWVRRELLISELEGVQRAKAEAEAYEATLLAKLDAWRPDDDVAVRDEWARQAWIRDEVAVVLRVAPQTASGRLARAAVLVAELPETHRALRSGVITAGHAHAVLEATLPLDAETSARLEARVLRGCESVSVGEFRARCRRAVIALDPSGAERRHEAASRGRAVRFRAGVDGMGELSAHLDLASLARIEQRVRTLAASVAPGERSVDAVRADVFCDLLLDTGSHPAGGAAGGSPIQVTVAMSTLLGLDDLPGEINRESAPASLVRHLANDPNAWWRPVLLDRDGHVEAVGSRGYRPSAALRRLVELHDRTCQFPGCRRRAGACELDHVVPFDHADPAAGGPTELENLHALCKRHHRLKHEAGWRVIRKDGVTTWISPTSRVYTKVDDGYLDPRSGSDGPGNPPDDRPPF